jgi:metacaspase-1
MKKGICVGINNYPGTINDLNGCVNDANDWASLLDSFGFQTTKILDEQASKANILSAFQNLVTNAVAGDVVVFTYSGHGTQILDTSSDEADGYDEAIYVYDGAIIDDEFRTILNTANKDAEIIVITDSCFSGTVTRLVAEDHAKRRFIKTDEIPPSAILKSRFLSKMVEEDMVEILIAGCSDSEYSYDAYINGKYNGAMTANAIPLLVEGITYNEFYTKLRALLPSTEYPQTPQLEGSIENKKNKIFTEKTGSGGGGNSGGGNGGGGNGGGGTGGGSASTGCLSTFLSIIAIAAVLTFVLMVSL